jgi:Ca2+:H+ antiporter
MDASHVHAISPGAIIREEAGLIAGVVTLAVFLTAGSGWLASMSGWRTPLLLFGWLFPVMPWLSFGVVHHADGLAIKLGEPYGTLILTLWGSYIIMVFD